MGKKKSKAALRASKKAFKAELSRQLASTKAAKPVKVTIVHTKHETQPWKVVIDDAGNGPKLAIKERYARPFTAKRGAVRKLGGYIHRQWMPITKSYKTIGYRTQDGGTISFIVKYPKK